MCGTFTWRDQTRTWTNHTLGQVVARLDQDKSELLLPIHIAYRPTGSTVGRRRAATSKRPAVTRVGMARNVRVETLEGISRPIVAIRHDYRRGHVIPSHKHRRSQLLCSLEGVMVVTTLQGAWVIPPHRGVWIPGGTMHTVRLVGAASTLSLYIEPAAVADLSTQCCIVEISPFVHALVDRVVDLPIEYEVGGRSEALMTLLLQELRALPVSSLALALPRHERLLKLCERFLARPQVHQTIDSWCDEMSISRRAFTRLFRSETGLSFAEWRQQAYIAAALPRLAAGESVTSVALDLGYDNPAAFTTMFKRILGTSPRRYAALDRPTVPFDAAGANLAGHFVSVQGFNVDAGRNAAFEALWRSRQRELESMPGFAALHVLRATEGHGTAYMVISVWLTQADRDAWRRNESISADDNRYTIGFPATGDFLLVELE